MARAQDVPAGTFLFVRLQHPLFSYSLERGDPLRAVLIAPVTSGGDVLLPAGATLQGRVVHVSSVGLGLRRERARLGIDFDTLILPGGERRPLRSRLHAVDNARETIDTRGRIVGIRATATLGYRVSGWILGATTGDPLLMLFSLGGTAGVIRFAESEIVFPAGTEMRLELAEPLAVGRTFPRTVEAMAQGTDDTATLSAFVAGLPFRTATPGGKLSDLTNVLLIGDANAIERAFHAAGWATSAELNATTAYRTFRAMAQEQGYDDAPMSLLLLDGRAPAQTWQKALNTFAERHHLRVFASDERWKGLPVWSVSSTQDVGIGFSRKSRTFIHLIDSTIDNERNKVVNDLAFTGCVDAVELVERHGLPAEMRNATNEVLLTDGRIAVVQLNACTDPHPFVGPAPDIIVGRALGNPVQRGFRQFFLSMKHQFWRGNIIYASGAKAVQGFKLLFRRKHASEPTEPAVTVDGVVYTVAGDDRPSLPDADDPKPAARPIAEPPRSGEAPSPSPVESRSPIDARAMDAPPVDSPTGASDPSVEIFFGPAFTSEESLGHVGFGLVGDTVGDAPDDLPLIISFPVRIERGAGVAAKVTLRQGRWLGHELSYAYTRATLVFDLTGAEFALLGPDGTPLLNEPLSTDPVDAALVVRSLGYAFTAYVRPREARVRPYLVAGPTLVSYQLRDGTRRNSSFLRRVGLGTVGSVVSAVRSGRQSPLDGGAVYRWGVSYGGGVRARVTNTLGLRFDVRGTTIAVPDFSPFDTDDLNASAEMLFVREERRLQRVTITGGITFSF